jgi:DNA-binding IclR family transcriptional regulator
MPVQPSPAVQRAALVLNTLADDPERDWGLTELARTLDSHPASCHTVLLALVEAGMVQRRGTRATFRLGPALVPLGERAQRAIGIVELAEPELTALRDRYGATAMLGMVSDSTIIAVSVFPAPQPLGYGIVPDMAVPFKAPIGSLYVAWESEETIDAWIRRSRPEIPSTRERTLKSDLGVIRARGWSATTRSDGQRGLSAYREVRNRDLEGDLLLVGISAPVLDRNGAVACSLALSTFSERVPGIRLLEMAGELMKSAQRLSGRCDPR